VNDCAAEPFAAASDEDGIAFAINERDGVRDPSEVFLAGRESLGGAIALFG
jgi:hypothetical protein